PTKELAQIVFSVMQGVSAHPKRSGNAASDTTTFCIEHLASTNLFFGTQAQPRRKRRCVSELRDIRADLAEDCLRSNRADARYVCKINSKDAVQLVTQIKTLRFVSAPLVRRCFGALWRSIFRIRCAVEIT